MIPPTEPQRSTIQYDLNLAWKSRAERYRFVRRRQTGFEVRRLSPSRCRISDALSHELSRSFDLSRAEPRRGRARRTRRVNDKMRGATVNRVDT
ncbi:hypothetical protein HPB50_020291 [Hyalomma asiaticum]|uniref:Uncharacterized protein n=1 Tax=Hyalomma asiaticum TaxID=266040 RepID=A0ACB7SXP9_HYAAI|nr:hypothetical protein HPB50_020291 [Hyalomma asiaticum]